MAISVPEGSSSIVFTPGANIPAGIITVRGAGEVEVSLNGGAANSVTFNNSFSTRSNFIKKLLWKYLDTLNRVRIFTT